MADPNGRLRSRVSDGAVALTYDDGPEPRWTERILAELEEHGARATFFVEAERARAHPQTLERIAAAGHEIGFHCVEHRRHSERTGAEVAAEAARGLGVLADLGLRPHAWRPPYGDATDATFGVAAVHGMALWGWSFDSHDWRGDDAESMLESLRLGGGLSSGEVVLMHDSVGRGKRRDGCEETVSLTRRLLRAAAEAGLRAKAVSESPPARAGR